MAFDQLLTPLKVLAIDVGEFIRTEAKGFNRKHVEYKGMNDMVSYVDKQAEKQIVKVLNEMLPEAGFIAEEGTGDVKEVLNWIIDPLDGTTNFIHGIPTYAVSIALHHKKEGLQLGVVYEVNLHECFSAAKGKGAFLNDNPIRVSLQQNLKNSLIATGFPYDNFDKVEEYLKVLQTVMRNSHGIRRIGSAAVDLAYVACGRFEAFYEYNLKPWDVAAGALIVKEAGGEVSDFKRKDDYIFGREIMAAGKVHSQLLDVIHSHYL